LIDVKNLSRIYNERGQPVTALRDVTFSVSRGESVAITGPSGSGKSTLLRILGALDRDFNGTVYVGNYALHDISEAKSVAFRAKEVGFVFQSFNLMTHLTALENLELTRIFRSDASSSTTREKALELLERVGLKSRADAFPPELSGGQQQRVAIARALMGDPSVLLCDEPTGNLDMTTGQQILDLLGETRLERDVTILLVTHEPHVVEQMERRIELEDGAIVGGATVEPTAGTQT
jgi:putative ABC transport system ATP-binding protein